MFGPSSYTLVEKVAKLPYRCPTLHRRITPDAAPAASTRAPSPTLSIGLQPDWGRWAPEGCSSD